MSYLSVIRDTGLQPQKPDFEKTDTRCSEHLPSNYSSTWKGIRKILPRLPFSKGGASSPFEKGG